MLSAFNGFIDGLPKWVVALVSVAVGLATSTVLELFKDRRARIHLEQALCKEVASMYFHIAGALSVFKIPGEDPIANPPNIAELDTKEDCAIVIARNDLAKRLHMSAYKYAQSNAALYYRLRKLDQLVAIYYSVNYVLDSTQKMTGNVFRTIMGAALSSIERAVAAGTFTQAELKGIDNDEIRSNFLTLRK